MHQLGAYLAFSYFLKRKERGKKWQKCGIIFEGSLQQKDKGRWTCFMTDNNDRKFIQSAKIRYNDYHGKIIGADD